MYQEHPRNIPGPSQENPRNIPGGGGCPGHGGRAVHRTFLETSMMYFGRFCNVIGTFRLTRPARHSRPVKVSRGTIISVIFQNSELFNHPVCGPELVLRLVCRCFSHSFGSNRRKATRPCLAIPSSKCLWVRCFLCGLNRFGDRLNAVSCFFSNELGADELQAIKDAQQL